MSQSYAIIKNLTILDHSISLSKLLIDDTSVQYGFNADKVDGCDVLTVAPLGADVSDAYILNDIAMRDFVYPIGVQYKQYPVSASNTTTVAFPVEETPAFMFGGSWRLLWATENIFFRTEGESGTRTNGLQQNATARNGISATTSGELTTYGYRHIHYMQDHYHLLCGTSRDASSVYSYYPIADATRSAYSGNSEYTLHYSVNPANVGVSSAPINDYTSSTGIHRHSFVGAGTETRPNNRLFKIWERYA